MELQRGEGPVASNTQALAGLTESQRLGLREVLLDVSKAKAWSWELPVLLRDRCWLRLDRIRLSELMRYIPPDGRDEAPELMHYQQLMAQGIDPLLAQQNCWLEFVHQNLQHVNPQIVFDPKQKAIQSDDASNWFIHAEYFPRGPKAKYDIFDGDKSSSVIFTPNALKD